MLVTCHRRIPSYQLVTPGGDTALVANFEYRIPIFGPVTLAVFFDAGMNRLLNTSQLNMNPDRITQLNAEFPEASFPDQRRWLRPGRRRFVHPPDWNCRS